jgi:hypothetical protein
MATLFLVRQPLVARSGVIEVGRGSILYKYKEGGGKRELVESAPSQP